MSIVYLGNNQEIDVKQVSIFDISHTLEDEIIIIHFKDYSSEELAYKTRHERDQDFAELMSAYREHNGLEDPEREHYDGEALC